MSEIAYRIPRLRKGQRLSHGSFSRPESGSENSPCYSSSLDQQSSSHQRRGEGQEETGPSALHEEVSREPHIRKHSLQTGPGDHPGKQQAAHSAGTHRDLEIAQEKEMPGVPPTDSPKLSGPRTNRIRDVLTTPE